MPHQLTVRLSAHGELLLSLPGAQNASRDIKLRKDDAGETLLRILHALAEDKTEIGLDGAPTQAQVRHWERHQIWPDAACRFCLAEGRVKPARQTFKKKELVYKTPDGVEVRKIRTGASGPQTIKSRKTAEECGL